MFVQHNKIPLLSLHAKRLQESFLKINCILSIDDIVLKINKLLESTSGISQEANKCRLLVEFFPLKANIEEKWTMELSTVPYNIYTLNEKGIRLTHYSEEKISTNIFTNCKTNDRKIYDNARNFAQQNNFDDAIIENENGFVADCSIYNLFLIKGEQLFTPKLSDNIVAGVARQCFLQYNTKYTIIEKSLSIQNFYDADAVFVSNALRGIQSVQQFGNHIYNDNIVKLIHQYWKNILREHFSIEMV